MARFVDHEGFELVDWDAATGRSIWAKDEGDKTIYRTDYPVDRVLELNAEQRKIAAQGWKGDYHQIASIPVGLLGDTALGEAVREGDDKYLSRWLNDGDNRAWRTKEGNV